MEEKKILFISYSAPFPPIDGKRQRTFAQLKAFEENYNIDYLVIGNKKEYELASSANNFANVRFFFVGEDRISIFYRLKKSFGFLFIKNYAVQKKIAQLAHQNNYAFVFSRYIKPVVHVPPDLSIICDVDDDFIEKYKSKISNTKGLLRRLRLWQILQVNYPVYKRLLGRSRRTIFTKLQDLLPNSFLLPNLPFQMIDRISESFHPSDNSQNILYIGKLSYAPNAQGLRWFLKSVWPLLLQEYDGLELKVVSSVDPGLDLMNEMKESRNVSYLGRVSEIESIYQSTIVVIAPIFWGAGTNIKVAEALLMGRPVVTTTFASKGFETARKNGFIFSTDDPIDYKNFILTLLRDIRLHELQHSIWRWSKNEYSFSKWKERLQTGVSGQDVR